jgi:isoquinoline 1-oxidoreductase beta subunit
MNSSANDKMLSRRHFLKISGMAGTALCLGFLLPVKGEDLEVINASRAENTAIELNPWIIIDTSGKITLMNHRAEMGQGVYQSVAQVLAEELEVDLDKVHIEFGKGDIKYGNQVTGGSSTIRTNYRNFLKLSATAREMLILAAANKWSVQPGDCYASSGQVIHKSSGKSFHYGELVVDASKLPAPKNVPLKKRSAYKLIGKPLRRMDTPMKINGTAVFGIDKQLPGMLYACVERSPRLHGKIVAIDDTAALKVPGVKHIVPVKMGVHNIFREGVAIVATSTWAAMQGRKALKVTWNDSGFEHISTPVIYKRMADALANQEGLPFRTNGDPNKVLKESSNKIDIIYETPYQSHCAMEPLNCIAYYQPGKIEIWGPIQAPDWIQDYISQQLSVPREKVIVHLTFLGGGFGRKAFMDYPHEAVLISKEIGAPVQVVWTREDDVTQGPFRPGISYRCQGVVAEGEIQAFKVTLAGQNNDHWRGGPKDKPNRSATEGFLKDYFDSIKHIGVWDIPFETVLPTMWWRSVYASTNGFAFESFIDELAVAAKQDPMKFRRKYLKSDRCQQLIDKLEEVSGWKNKQQHAGYGVAITECFGTTVGQVVKVSKPSGGKLQIDQVWAAIDCGWYVNPDTIRAQVEGAIVMALGAACNHELTFTDGKANEHNFYAYKMPRINEIPPIEVHIMENEADAGGVGEPGLPPFAPALTNAIFDLTGKRIRRLPFLLGEV